MDCIQQIRPHKGQIETGANFRKLLEGSELIARPKQHVQDPYSFRCIPQVHGATKDAIRYVASVLLTEINSVTDNPTIFPDEDRIISAVTSTASRLPFPTTFSALPWQSWAIYPSGVSPSLSWGCVDFRNSLWPIPV